MKATDALWKRYQSRVDEGIVEEDMQRKRTADQLHEDYIYLEHRVEKLTLICRAMWEILSETNDWDDARLFSKVKAIDRLDGKVDGKISAKVVPCPECGHPVNTRHPMCVYCGFRDFNIDPFSKV